MFIDYRNVMGRIGDLQTRPNSYAALALPDQERLPLRFMRIGCFLIRPEIDAGTEVGQNGRSPRPGRDIVELPVA